MRDGQPAETTACGRYQKRAIVIMVRRIVRMAVEDMVGLFLGLVMGMTMQGSFRIMLGHDFGHCQRAVRCVARDRKHGKANNQRDRQKRSHDVVEISHTGRVKPLSSGDRVKTQRHQVISGTIVMRSALGSMKDGQAIGLAAPIAHNS